MARCFVSKFEQLTDSIFIAIVMPPGILSQRCCAPQLRQDGSDFGVVCWTSSLLILEETDEQRCDSVDDWSVNGDR